MRRLLIALLLVPGWASAATYYVDCNAGAGGDGSLATPWDAVADVNAASFSAGDSVLFAKGCTFREQLTVPSSGSAGNPITFGAYGSGSKPIISGADVASSWTTELQSLASDAYIQGLWYLEDATGATRLDATTNDNDLTDNSSVGQDATSPKQGTYSADFDGTSYLSRINASLSSNFPFKAQGDFTIGGWVRFADADSGAWTTIMSKGNDFNMKKTNTNVLQFFLRDSSATLFTCNADAALTNADDGVWHHIVVRWQGSTDDELSLWVDNIKQADAESPADLGLSTDPFALGSKNGTEYVTGDMDEWWAFSRALTDEEIEDIYTAGMAGTGGGTSLYYTSADGGPNQVYRDDARLSEEATSKSGCGTGEFWWDAGNSRVYVYDNPATATMMEVGARAYCIDIGQSHVTLENLVCEKSESHGVKVNAGSLAGITLNGVNVYRAYLSGFFLTTAGNTDLTIRNGEFAYNGGNGINFDTVDGALVASNSVHHNANLAIEAVTHDYTAGIKITNSLAENVIVEHNEVYENGTTGQSADRGSGIWTDYYVPGIIIRFNESHDNYRNGIHIEGGSNGAQVYYNVTYGNRDAGIQLSSTGSDPVHDNVVANNVSYGSSFEGFEAIGTEGQANTCYDNTVVNNIVIEGAQGFGAQVNFKVDDGCDNTGTEGSGNVYKNNLIYGDGGGGGDADVFIRWNGTDYASVAAWEAATSGAAEDNLEADPLFISSSDFRLQAGSPAINAGVDVGLTADYWGYPVYGLPDIGAVESQQAAAALRFPLARLTQTTEGNVVRFDNRH